MQLCIVNQLGSLSRLIRFLSPLGESEIPLFDGKFHASLREINLRAARGIWFHLSMAILLTISDSG